MSKRNQSLANRSTSLPIRPLRSIFRTTLGLTLGALLAQSGTGSAEAQMVRGQVIDQVSGFPVAGALVVAETSGGARLAGSLTDEEGRFTFDPEHLGEFLILVERIGYLSSRSEKLRSLPDDSLDLSLEIAPSPIQLSEMEIRGEQVCRLRPEEGLAVARVWEEARKALAIQEWSEDADTHSFRVGRFENRLSGRGRLISSETWEEEGVFNRVPFRSLPVAALQKEGFVQQTAAEGTEFFAPDANVLLSDEFLDTHCFRLNSERELEGVLGVSFEPIGRTTGIDIVGVLWVERGSSRLQSVDFSYEPNYWTRREFSGGSVDFHQLPNGSWVVERWVIRMPTEGGYLEVGAEIIHGG